MVALVRFAPGGLPSAKVRVERPGISFTIKAQNPGLVDQMRDFVMQIGAKYTASTPKCRLDRPLRFRMPVWATNSGGRADPGASGKEV